MVKTFFMNLGIALLIAVGCIICCEILSYAFLEILGWIFGGFPTGIIAWFFIIATVIVVGAVTLFIMAFFSEKIADTFSPEAKPIYYRTVVMLLLPILLLAIIIAIVFYFNFDAIILMLKESIAGSIKSSKYMRASEWMDIISIIVALTASIVVFLFYFLVMCIAYDDIKCAHCGAMGGIGYNLIDSHSDTRTEYKGHTSSEKVGEIKVDDRSLMDIYGEKQYYTVQEVTTTHKTFQGKCCYCGKINTKNKVSFAWKDI